MAFIRTKTLKGNRYAYLVENVWTDKGPRQKAKKYLGRVYDFRREKEILFNEYYPNYNLELRSKKEILQDCIRIELICRGFIENSVNKWKNNGCFVDLKKLDITNHKGKSLGIGLNDGILCKPLLHKALNLKIEPSKEEPEKEGYVLAKLLVECGLKVSHEMFIRLYELSKV
jgi:hypothetical protein